MFNTKFVSGWLSICSLSHITANAALVGSTTLEDFSNLVYVCTL